MALDTNIPMQGQQIDTASPLIGLVNMNRQAALDKATLAQSNVETASKANLYTMQVMSAGAAGGQAAYDAAKQHVAQVVGPDAVAGWAPDAATGAQQAAALQKALIPPAVMMNAGIQQQKADAETATANGVNAPIPPNSGLAAKAPVQAGSGPVAGAASLSSPGMTLPGAPPQPAPVQTPQGQPSALPQEQVQPRDQQQGIQQLQQHYQNASPDDQKQAQAVVNGALQLQSLQNDPQAVQKFLDDPNNIHDQANIDMRKLWQSDTTPGKQQFWAQNAAHIKVGQAVGIIPAQGDASTQPQQAQPQATQISPDYPNPPQPNENPKAKQERQAGNLAIQQANLANDPAHAAAMKAADSAGTKEGDTIGEATKTLNIMQSNLPMALQRFDMMRNASQDASSGLFVNNDGNGIKQDVWNSVGGKTAEANNLLEQKAAQGILPELGPQLQQAGIRGNKFLETIASNASGLNMAAPPEVKTKLIDGLELTYINNLKSTAAQLRANGKPAPTDAEIDAQVQQIKSGLGGSAGGQSSGDVKQTPSGIKYRIVQ